MHNHIKGACGGTVFANLPPQAASPIFYSNNQDKSMIDFRSIKHNKLRITFKTQGDIEHTLRGRVAQTICWLCEQQQRGVTAQEMSSWALRLGAYIHILRHKYNVNIRTDDEPHEGGIHGRYVLISPIQIVNIENLAG